MLTALLVATCLQGDATQLLKEIAASYHKLDALSLTIEHHDSSGLFPGDYTQELKWKKGGRFELRVTKPNPLEIAEPGSKAPDYYCDGAEVVTLWPDGRRSPRALNTDPNISPGYEVSAGFILSFLLDSPNVKRLLAPAPEFGMTWTLGPESEWRGDEAKTFNLNIARDGQTVTGIFYYAQGPLRILGMEYEASNQSGWMRYRDQKHNPKLPDKLGEPPPQEAKLRSNTP